MLQGSVLDDLNAKTDQIQQEGRHDSNFLQICHEYIKEIKLVKMLLLNILHLGL